MASYRPYPPQPSYPPPPPGQNPLPPPPPPPSSFPPNFNPTQPNLNHHQPYPSSGAPPPPPPHQPYSYPPPPPPDSSFPPLPPPPHSSAPPSLQPPLGYYQQSQYSQFGQQLPPPPPPRSPPSSSSVPPPPPPGSPPPPPPSAPPPLPPPPESKDGVGHKGSNERDKGVAKQVSGFGRREDGRSNRGAPLKQQVPPVPHVRKPTNAPPGRVETEEERRLRKKKDFEKQRQEEKLRQQMKGPQNAVSQKTQIMSSGKGHGSVVGSRMEERRATPLLTGDRIENRLKKPTTFLCKLKFRNELPDPSAQLKLMTSKRDKDQYTKYTITSLEKLWKPKIFVEPDLGIPLDLLDLSVYNPPKVRPPLAPEDEELLRDDDVVTPIKKDGIRRKERPTDKGVSWLVKTQYISSLSMESARQSMTEKQAKELREMKGGRNILDNLNNRARQIKEIEASFEACKSRPVHPTNKSLKAVEVLPLLPNFDRYDEQFVVATFDGAPTADSEIYGKLNQSVRDAHESRAILKSYAVAGSDAANPEKFLAYMVPSVDELSKDMYDENEDISYTWVREYHWDVRGDDADDPTTYLVSFDDGVARYLPLPTKLNLRKKRAREGRSVDEMEHFPVPSRVTVRQRPAVAVIEHRDAGGYSNAKGGASSSKMRRLDNDDGLGRSWRHAQSQDANQYSEPEDFYSE